MVMLRRSPKTDGRPSPAPPTRAVVRSLPFDGDEIALVAGMRAGRADAGAAFYDRHVRAIQALAFRLMGPDPELEDVVHEIFVRALDSLSALRDPATLKSWLFGIAVRAVAIRFQKRRRGSWLRFMAPEDVPQATTSPDPDAREAIREAWAILAAMDPEERVALLLHRVEGLSLEDGAKAMGLSLATYRRRLARGQDKFFVRARSRPALATWIDEGDAHA
jgi:RNA polymerase sigma-70 factor (ECF subfamily)